MASVYLDPGAYVEEKIVQGAISLAQVPLAVTLVGIASQNRLVENEVVIRQQNTLVLSVATASPHIAALSPISDGLVGNTQVTRDGVGLPNTSWTLDSNAQITIKDAAYKSGSVYRALYVAPSQTADTLANAGVQALTRVGSFPSVTSFEMGTDYSLVGNTIDWSILTFATLTGVAGPYNLSTNNNIRLSLDGKVEIQVNVAGVTPAATTATEIAAILNAAFTANMAYGAPYGAAASVTGGNTVVVKSIVPGEAGSVKLLAATTTSAHLVVFGVATIALPTTVTGTGRKPAPATAYYATYEYTRPNTDFNNPFQFFSLGNARAILGLTDTDNPLGIYSEFCFEQGAPSIYCVIIKDSDSDGIYTNQDYINGIAATEVKAGMTEIVPMSAELQVQVAAFNSVINMSSSIEKKPRRLWLGMATGTVIGDEDTPDSYIYRAARTLQVPGDSPGRGRFILSAPDQAVRTITLIDGTQLDVPLNGTAIAAASAAKNTSFTSAATSMLRKNITGFKSIPVYGDKERRRLASKGVNVVTLNAGVMTFTDPVTTEVAGGGLQEFIEISVGVQKDKVQTLVAQQVDSNLTGIVPEDLSDFISDIKEVVATVLRALIDSKDIGPFTNDNGTPRDINLATDIQAYQSPSDKTQFGFRFYFNARYPAKRFFGEFSVDNPFFSPTNSSATS